MTFANAGVLELADEVDSKSIGGDTVRVRPPPPAPRKTRQDLLFGLSLIPKVRGSNPWAAPFSKHACGMFAGAGAAAAARSGFAKRKHVDPRHL